MPQLELRDCRLLTVRFDLSRNFTPGAEARIDTKLSLTHNYFQDEGGNSLLRLIVKVAILGEAAPLTAEVEMGSVLAVAEAPASPAAGLKLAEIEGATLVFPFLRETVADLTRRAGLAPLYLPAIDFVEFYKKNHPGE